MRNSLLYPVTLLALVLAVLAWSAVAPFDRFTWWLEVAPALLGIAVLAATWRRFPFTPLVATLIALHMVLLCFGGKYTYARVPLGEWVRDWLHLARNHYDRLGHFAQGFVPAMITREIVIRHGVLRPRAWRAFFVTMTALGISALYELVEWLTAISSGEAATDFLGTQGDVWDTQEDMAVALIGALVAQALLFRWHDRQLRKLADQRP